MVKTGSKNGTFGQDKLQKLLPKVCRRNGVPYYETAVHHTSRRCTHCGYSDITVGNDSRDKNKKSPTYNLSTCPHCGAVENSDKRGALNCALYADRLVSKGHWDFDVQKQWNNEDYGLKWDHVLFPYNNLPVLAEKATGKKPQVSTDVESPQ